MQWIKNLSVGMVLIALVGSCLKQPEYDIAPNIRDLTVSFKRGTGGNDDTLTFTMKFRDGDGDLGINGDETFINSTDINSPFYYLYDTTTNKILYYTHAGGLTKVNLDSLAPNLSYVNYKAKRLHRIDTLPDLTCKHWTPPTDTIYFLNNPYYYNFFVDSYAKNSSGGYDYLDPTLIHSYGKTCIPNFFNSRFQVLSSDLGKKSPLDGTLTFRAPSAEIYSVFQGKKIKFKIYILDRAFHKSNVDSVFYSF